MATRMLQRRGTAAEWAAENPVLASGEIGFETDTKMMKMGDGVTPWNDLTLPYVQTAGGTMTGALVLQAPTADDQAARLADVKAGDASLPQGVIKLAKITTSTTNITSSQTIAGVTAVLSAGRLYKLTFSVELSFPDASTMAFVTVMEGTTQIYRARIYGPGHWSPGSRSMIIEATTGTHNYNLRVEKASGTGQLDLRATADNPTMLLLEDVGPVV